MNSEASISEQILAVQKASGLDFPAHLADDETTLQVMDWVSREAKMALSLGDLWVRDDPDEDLIFGYLTPNGEKAIKIFEEKIKTSNLESWMDPLSPPEVVFE